MSPEERKMRRADADRRFRENRAIARDVHNENESSDVAALDSGVDLYWLPLGAGGHSVRLNGRVFEAVAAGLERRRACDLYHSALEVRAPQGRFVIEMTPISAGDGAE
jgi:hypothetical protein